MKASNKKQTKAGKDAKGKKKKAHKKLGLAKFVLPMTKPKRKPQSKAETKEEESEPQQKVRNNPVPSIFNKNMGLIDRCKQQMSSSLLRLIDETLYTSDVSDIPLDRDKFIEYHEAYAEVCKKWPTQPIDYIVKFIKRRMFPKKPVHRFRFADVGCGKEPLLKSKLPPKTIVQSFDIVSVHEDVTEANMEHLPVDDGRFDCAVYCLSLMAKNLGNVIIEAKRILKLKGSLLIVEVTSRFESRERRFKERVERLGFKQNSSTPLKPNGYFTFFHFTKINNELDYPPSAKWIELKPCIYKAR